MKPSYSKMSIMLLF